MAAAGGGEARKGEDASSRCWRRPSALTRAASDGKGARRRGVAGLAAARRPDLDRGVDEGRQRQVQLIWSSGGTATADWEGGKRAGRAVRLGRWKWAGCGSGKRGGSEGLRWLTVNDWSIDVLVVEINVNLVF